MKYLLFLLWIPAAVILYLSIHQEIVAENGRDLREKPHVIAHAGHAH